MIGEERIRWVYWQLDAATRQLYTATEAEINAKEGLEVAKLAAIADGQIQGKNEAEREARARDMLPVKYAALSAAEVARRKARLSLDLANISVENLRMEMRLAELTA